MRKNNLRAEYTEFSNFSDAITAMENDGFEYFTVGIKGKKPYHFWTVGACGCYYIYRCMPSGHAGAKRQIEISTPAKVYQRAATE